MSDIKTFINSIEGEDYSTAQDQFNSVLDDKLQAALDQKRVEVASRIFNKAEESDEEEMDYSDAEDYEFED